MNAEIITSSELIDAHNKLQDSLGFLYGLEVPDGGNLDSALANPKKLGIDLKLVASKLEALSQCEKDLIRLFSDEG